MTPQRFAWTLLAASYGYAFVRYVIGKGVPLSRVPLYITNKAVALTAVLLIAAALCVGPLARLAPARFGRWRRCAKPLGWMGFGGVLLHVMITTLILKPAYFERFYQVDGSFTGWVEVGLLCGALGATLLLIQAWGRAVLDDARHAKRFRIAALLLSIAHVASFGALGWLTPQTWPLALPPITLLAALTALVALSVRVWATVRARVPVGMGRSNR